MDARRREDRLSSVIPLTAPPSPPRRIRRTITTPTRSRHLVGSKSKGTYFSLSGPKVGQPTAPLPAERMICNQYTRRSETYDMRLRARFFTFGE